MISGLPPPPTMLLWILPPVGNDRKDIGRETLSTLTARRVTLSIELAATLPPEPLSGRGIVFGQWPE